MSQPDDFYPRQYFRASVDSQPDWKPSRRDRRNNGKDFCCDKWEWRAYETLVMVHNIPRRKMFVPKEADYTPCKLRWIRDERETHQMFQSSERTVKDPWRLSGNNVEKTNRRNDYWKGTTTFKVLFHPADAQSGDADSDVEDRVSSQDDVVTCKFPERTKLTPLDDMFMFIVQNYKLKHETRTQAYWDIRLVPGTPQKEWKRDNVLLSSVYC